MDYTKAKVVLVSWQKHKGMLNTILLVALTGLVYIHPFQTDFRFTISIAVLSSLLLYFERLPAMTTIIDSGIMIIVLRSALDLLGGVEWSGAMQHNLPTLGYYLAFGFGFRFMRIRDYIGKVPNLLLLLSTVDVFSNCIELLLRKELAVVTFTTVFESIVGVALARAILALLGYYALKQYHAFVLAEDYLARYAELLMMTAKLKAELFFLNKSSWDIEQVMEKSYLLYKKLHVHFKDDLSSSDSVAAQALAVSRDIHEIKKDYYRVISGIEGVLKAQPFEAGMSFSEMLLLIEQSTMRYLSSINKEIDLSFTYKDDFITDQYYTIVAILDNLIMNAIDACSEQGKIRITQWCYEGRIVFTVEDDGCGIKTADRDYIFNAGYSTKFSPRTGKMSTGIGLTHVKNLVEKLAGDITLDSPVSGGTCFRIIIPAEELLRK